MSKLANNNNNNHRLMETKSVLDPAFDYLKKWDNNCSWEDIPPPPERMIDVERERFTNLVSNNNSSMLFPPQTSSISLGTSSVQAASSSSGFCNNLKQMLMSDSTSNSSSNNYVLMSPFKRHAFKEEHEHLETTTAPFSGLSNNNNMEFPLGMKISSLLGGGGGDCNNKYGYGITTPSYTRVRNNHEDGAPFITSSNISDCKRRNGFLTSSPPVSNFLYVHLTV